MSGGPHRRSRNSPVTRPRASSKGREPDHAPPSGRATGLSMPDRIPFLDVGAGYRELKDELDEAVGNVLDSGWFLLGKETDAFETEYAQYTQSRHCVGVASGLDALTLSLRALGVGPGDEVVVPSNTYIATWLAVSAVGATPVPVEPLPGVWNIDPARIEDAITVRTKVIAPVHLYGQPADLDPILEIAQRRELRILEDAAQAHGARYNGRRVGAHGDIVAWSFYPGKNLGCFGDGGAVTTNDAALAERVRLLRNYGSRLKYKHEIKGSNSRIDEIQSAVLRVKLRHLDAWNDRRSKVASIYRKALLGTGGVELPHVRTAVDPVWHLFVVDVKNRDRVQARLNEMGVETLVHYPVPPHLSEAYASDRSWGRFPITESAARTHLSLPIGPHLSLEGANRVIASVCVALEPGEAG